MIFLALQRLAILALGAGLLTFITPPSQASTHAGTYNSVISVIPPTTPSWGLVINESLTGGASNTLSKIIGISNFIPSKLCKSTKDQHCAVVDAISVQLVLPACTNASSRMCIEGLEVGSNSAALAQATLDHAVASEPTPADSEIGLAAGGSPTLWKVPSAPHAGGSDTYGVLVNVTYYQGVKQPSKLTLQTLSASVVPILMTPQYGNVAEAKEVVEKFGPSKGAVIVDTGQKDGAAGPVAENLKCLWTELALCAQISPYAKDTKVALTLRLNTDLTGWLFGRMKEISVSTVQLDTNNSTLRIEAKPVDVPAAIGWLPKSEISKNPLIESYERSFRANEPGWFERVQADPSSAWAGFSSGAGGFASFMAYEQVLKPVKSQGERWLIFSSISSLVNNAQSTTGINTRCLANTGKVLGIVTTNSMIYASGPPEFKDGTLTYKVAGLHTDLDGELSRGTYDLAIRSDVARCLYGFSNAPIQASISVIGTDGQEQAIATESIREDAKREWLFLSARNFTFSSPTIRIKLTQSEKIIANNKTAAGSKKLVPAKKTITCTKGKTSKKITALTPKCPSGYKKA